MEWQGCRVEKEWENRRLAFNRVWFPKSCCCRFGGSPHRIPTRMGLNEAQMVARHRRSHPGCPTIVAPNLVSISSRFTRPYYHSIHLGHKLVCLALTIVYIHSSQRDAEAATYLAGTLGGAGTTFVLTRREGTDFVLGAGFVLKFIHLMKFMENTFYGKFQGAIGGKSLLELRTRNACNDNIDLIAVCNLHASPRPAS